MLRSVPVGNVSNEWMERNRDAAPIGLTVKAVTPLLAGKPEAVTL